MTTTDHQPLRLTGDDPAATAEDVREWALELLPRTFGAEDELETFRFWKLMTRSGVRCQIVTHPDGSTTHSAKV